MTIILAILCFITISQFGLILYLAYEMRTYSRESEQMIDIMKRQNTLLGNNGKMFDRVITPVSDLVYTLIDFNKLLHDHDKRFEEINEWVTSVDDNIADMRKDIQKILYKFDENTYHYIYASTEKAKDISLQDLADLNGIYYKSNMRLFNYDSKQDDQKGDEANEQT